MVPLSNRSKLTVDEQISLRHLIHFLGHYDKYLIAPNGSEVAWPGFETRYFSRRFFGSMQAHGRLLYWPQFYKAFEDYKYILIYHLDALVFADELLDWCRTDIDYIGAPWIPCADTPWVEEPRVGNGGFAIMKITTVLKVLCERYRREPRKYWEDRFTGLFSALQAILRYPRRTLLPGFVAALPDHCARDYRAWITLKLMFAITIFFGLGKRSSMYLSSRSQTGKQVCVLPLRRPLENVLN